MAGVAFVKISLLRLFILLVLIQVILSSKGPKKPKTEPSKETCPWNLPNIINGLSERHPEKNRTVNYSCNNGFMLFGANTSLCKGTAWLPPPPVCIAPTCKTGPPKGKGNKVTLRIVDPYYMGAVIQFKCPQGLKLVGAEFTYCMGERWSAAVPKCTLHSETLTVAGPVSILPSVRFSVTFLRPTIDSPIITEDFPATTEGRPSTHGHTSAATTQLPYEGTSTSPDRSSSVRTEELDMISTAPSFQLIESTEFPSEASDARTPRDEEDSSLSSWKMVPPLAGHGYSPELETQTADGSKKETRGDEDIRGTEEYVQGSSSPLSVKEDDSVFKLKSTTENPTGTPEKEGMITDAPSREATASEPPAESVTSDVPESPMTSSIYNKSTLLHAPEATRKVPEEREPRSKALFPSATKEFLTALTVGSEVHDNRTETPIPSDMRQGTSVLSRDETATAELVSDSVTGLQATTTNQHTTIETDEVDDGLKKKFGVTTFESEPGFDSTSTEKLKESAEKEPSYSSEIYAAMPKSGFTPQMTKTRTDSNDQGGQGALYYFSATLLTVIVIGSVLLLVLMSYLAVLMFRKYKSRHQENDEHTAVPYKETNGNSSSVKLVGMNVLEDNDNCKSTPV